MNDHRDALTVALAALGWAVSMLLEAHGDHGPGPGCWRCAGLHEELDYLEAVLELEAERAFTGDELLEAVA